MKYLLSICFIFINCTIVYSQNLLSEMQGLKNDKGEVFFEVSGYTISVYEMNGMVDDEVTIRLVKDIYGLDHILRTYTDSTLKTKNKVIEGLIDTPDLPVRISQKCFLLLKEDKTVTALYLETSMKRDFALEEKIVHAFINGQLSKYVIDDREARFMPLAGKKISLPGGSEWIAPNKILHGDSQVSWSEFTSLSRADQYLKNQMAIDKADDIEYVEADDIKVLFDEKTAKARRVVYCDSSNPTLSNYLIVYYVVI